jgi:hypothetical protein
MAELTEQEIDQLKSMLNKHNTFTGACDFKGPVNLFNLPDNTTGNASITAHGLLPKLANDAAKYLDGTGNWTVITMPTQPTQFTQFAAVAPTTGTSQNVYGTPVELTASSGFESQYFAILVSGSASATLKMGIHTGAGNGTEVFSVLLPVDANYYPLVIPFKIVTATRITIRAMNLTNTSNLTINARITMLG